MTPECEQVIDVLAEPELPASAFAHADRCSSCAELIRLRGVARMPPAELAGDLLAQVRRVAADELSRHPKVRPWWMDVLALVVVTASFGLGAAVLLRKQSCVVCNSADDAWLISVAGTLAVVLLVATFAALSPSRARWPIAVWVTAAFGAAAVVLGGSGTSPPAFLKTGIPCLATELWVSLAPVALGLWTLKRSAYHPFKAGAMGLAGGTAGLLALHLHCDIGTAAHLSAFHVAPWLVLPVVALVVRARLATESYAP